MTRFVYDFHEGSKDQKDLLGGKGANLAEMTRLGLPVPPGFTITTDACREYMRAGHVPESLSDEVDTHLEEVEQRLGRRFGNPTNPLLVSVRSGGKFSMPGMMETVLNVGLNDETVVGLAGGGRNERFAYDAYRRLIQMFGKTVLGIDGAPFEDQIDALKKQRGVLTDIELTTEDMQELVESFKRIVASETGSPFPQHVRTQLDMAIRAVFDSWNTPRAALYRRQERIPHDLGTAVNVCAMVYGNLDDESGTGVAFTRDPATGAKGVYGDYLMNAQGEDVVAGIRNTQPLSHLEDTNKSAYDELMHIMSTLETHYRDLCDIEFTIESGKLWMLQTRVGKRTAAAAFMIASQLIDEDLITEEEAVTRVTGAQLAQLMFPRFDENADKTLLTVGTAASPGAASGHAVFDSDAAKEWTDRGKQVILVRRETNPDDLSGMVLSRGILTSRGGKTSHAAVVARGMGTTCVCGAEKLDVNVKERRVVAPDGTVVAEGDMVSIDGTTGEVYAGAVPVVPSDVVQYFEGSVGPDASELVTAVDRLMTIADRTRRMEVRANADNPEDTARAVRFGGQGVGLCRTEHMFLGDRKKIVQDLVLAATDSEVAECLAKLKELQRGDFVGILEAAGGRPVTVRLLDPPLHEFLPDLTELSVLVAKAEAGVPTTEDGEVDPDLTHHRHLLASVERLHEQNPMLGLRGVRLGLAIPGLYGMQTRALAEAAVEVTKNGGKPVFEVMIPLVSAVQELAIIKKEVKGVLADVSEEAGVPIDAKIGTMIELPRAAIRAGHIAEEAEFFSFGTNDLTQTTWGFSRDDVESEFFGDYLERGIFEISPFDSIDVNGVGYLVNLGVQRGRETRPELKCGICGEHGGDPRSIHFFERVGLDYVSCSPFRIPVARLEAGRAAVMEGTAGTGDHSTLKEGALASA